MEFKGYEATRVAYGRKLVELGAKDKNIVVLDADLSQSTQTVHFAKRFPERFFQMGIAEANMVCVAAGLALTGKKPFVSTFAIFGTGRAWEPIRTIVARANIPVRFCFSHAGITVGEDGSSAQSLEDIAITRVIPNMLVIVPSDSIETEKVIEYIASDKLDRPVYVRLTRNKVPIFNPPNLEFVLGKGHLLRYGKDIAIFAYGQMVHIALSAAEEVDVSDNIKSTVVNLSTIKPLDEKIILDISREVKKIIVIEEHSVIGGLGEAISSLLVKNGVVVDFIHMGIDDVFGVSGSAEALLEKYGLTVKALKNNILKLQRNTNYHFC